MPDDFNETLTDIMEKQGFEQTDIDAFKGTAPAVQPDDADVDVSEPVDDVSVAEEEQSLPIEQDSEEATEEETEVQPDSEQPVDSEATDSEEAESSDNNGSSDEMPSWFYKLPKKYQREARDQIMLRNRFTQKTQELSAERNAAFDFFRSPEYQDYLLYKHKNQQTPQQEQPEVKAPEKPEMPSEMTEQNLREHDARMNAYYEQKMQAMLEAERQKISQQMQPIQDAQLQQQMVASIQEVQNHVTTNNLPKVDDREIYNAMLQPQAAGLSAWDVYRILASDKAIERMQSMEKQVSQTKKQAIREHEKSQTTTPPMGKSAKNLDGNKSLQNQIDKMVQGKDVLGLIEMAYGPVDNA